MEGKLKILDTNQKSGDIARLYPILCAFGDLIGISLREYIHIKPEALESDMVLQTPDVHIFYIDTSLVLPQFEEW